jgi:hypothetical protein
MDTDGRRWGRREPQVAPISTDFSAVFAHALWARADSKTEFVFALLMSFVAGGGGMVGASDAGVWRAVRAAASAA